MPTVGGHSFPYTKKGKAAAKKEMAKGGHPKADALASKKPFHVVKPRGKKMAKGK